MKLIYIKSIMEPKNYSTIRSILKKAQGEKIAPNGESFLAHFTITSYKALFRAC